MKTFLILVLVSFVRAKTFSLPEGSVSAEELQGPFWNHKFCYVDNNPNSSGQLADQPIEFVPKGAIFLSSDVLEVAERVGIVPIGTKLIFIPIAVTRWYDLDDDVNSTYPDPSCAGRGSPELDAVIKESQSIFKNRSLYSEEPFATVNGSPLVPFFVDSENEYYYKSCPNDPNGPDKQICDYCDISAQSPEGCVPIGGVDVYPMYGWWGADETQWECGDKRIYHFGGTMVLGEGVYWVNTTYTLSAEEKSCPPASSSAITVICCASFGMLIFALLN